MVIRAFGWCMFFWDALVGFLFESPLCIALASALLLVLLATRRQRKEVEK